MTHWDYSLFNEKLGNKINYILVAGKPNSGKTTIANHIAQKFKYQLIDMKVVQEEIRKSLSTEEEPYEGEIKIQDVEKKIVQMINDGKASKTKYIFDGYIHSTAEQFNKFIEQFDAPNIVVSL